VRVKPYTVYGSRGEGSVKYLAAGRIEFMIEVDADNQREAWPDALAILTHLLCADELPLRAIARKWEVRAERVDTLTNPAETLH